MAHRSGRPETVDRPTDAQVDAAVATLTMLGDPTRLKLLWLIQNGEYDVGTLASLAGTTPTSASQHLAKLRLAGLVAARREGRRQVYVILDDHVGALVREALYHGDHRVAGLAGHD